MNPFRELFVELPLALLEAAVAQAEQRKAVTARPTKRISAFAQLLPSFMRSHFGWTKAVSTRCIDEDAIRVEGLSSCGHLQLVIISEHIEALRPLAAGNAIADAVHAQRRCFCVPRLD